MVQYMRIIALVLLCWCSISLCNADIYGYVSKNGTIHLTNLVQHNPQYRFVMSTAVYQSYNGVPTIGNIIATHKYNSIIQSAADKYGVKRSLVSAVIMTESGFNPNAISQRGAQGLMQLMPATATRFGVEDPFNAKQNINAGVKYLSELLKQFKNTRLAVAAYNAGAKAVEKYGDAIPPYTQTQAYVPIVLHYQKKYQYLEHKKAA